MSLPPPPGTERPPVLTLSNGIEVRTFAPPADFDPLTADDDTLLRNGFPARPPEGPHLDRFIQVLTRLKGRLHYIQPTLQVNADRFHGPLRRAAETQAGTETSHNWSGGVVYAPRGQSFSWVQGDWTVPSVGAPTAGPTYYCSSWIGLDGDRGSGDVCQAGVECDVSRTGTTPAPSTYPWFEWYPASEVAITNFPVNYGDSLTALVCAGPGAGATYAHLYFTNHTNGAYTSFSFQAPGQTKLVGNDAEWIVEAPLDGEVQTEMADYGQVAFSMCQAYLGSTGPTVNSGTGNNINMIDSNNQPVSNGSLTGPTGVQCDYVGPVP